MLRQVLLRARRPPPNPRILRNSCLRHYASDSPSRLSRLNQRLPKSLHKYTSALSNAPLTHITAFLLLHELTAIIPLFGLAATFHYTQWLPSWFAEGAWVLKGVDMFGRYFRRKGWIREAEAQEAREEAALEMRTRDRAWNLGEGGARLVVEFATAYAVTKVLLPVRVLVSLWGTPWFARWTVVPVGGFVGRVFGRGRAKKAVDGARGTGATDAGGLTKGTSSNVKKS